jgi:biotin carboxyl carrier protein
MIPLNPGSEAVDGLQGGDAWQGVGDVAFHQRTVGLTASNRDTSHQTVLTVEQELSRLAALLELVARVGNGTSPEDSCRVLANNLQTYLKCQQVIVGLCHSRSVTCDVTAISGRTHVDTRSEFARLAAAVLQECVARGQTSSWPPLAPLERHALRAHRQFAQTVDQPALVSLPLRDEEGHVRAALLITGQPQTVQDPRALSFLQAAEQPLSSTLALLVRARGHRVDRLLQQLAEAAGGRKGRVALLIAGLVLAVLALPVRYRVACDCELQPVVRRYVAAPFDGRLETSHVQPGDVVAADAVLARIDARDVQWELSGKTAELHRVGKELSGHVAAHETGKAEIAKLEAERLKLRIEQLEDQAANLDIRSPIAGIVLLGDLSKSEGVPLEKGQTLFEIAPLDRMVVELAIPEDDVRFVLPGASAHVRLEAFPLRSCNGTIQRVHPRAELKEHQNVFVAEFSIDNTGGTLRPGMRGKAHIATVRRPLGWNLFHKAVGATLMWLGW